MEAGILGYWEINGGKRVKMLASINVVKCPLL
jgi:hypothetical protein